METKTIELRNDFHGTTARVRATAVGLNNPPYTAWAVSAGAMRRADRRLCGMEDCTCGTLRGPRDDLALDAWAAYDMYEHTTGPIGQSGRVIVRR